jgi:hypothetical protein
MTEVQQKSYREFLTELVMVKNYGFKVIDKYKQEDDCIVCCISMKDKTVIIPPCNHTICHQCTMEYVIDWEFDQCPECSDTYKFKKQSSYDCSDDDTFEIDKDKKKKITVKKQELDIGGAIVGELSEVTDTDLFDEPTKGLLDDVEDIDLFENEVNPFDFLGI